MREIGCCGLDVKGYGSPGLTPFETGAIYYEFGRYDISVCLLLLVQNCVGISVMNHCGSDEQKKRILPDLVALKKFACFGLTEPEVGSDASNV
jgi:glutaryl-CoA dehydrogenase